jgi:hypothetical protein
MQFDDPQKHVRIAIEWDYSATANLFPLVADELKLHILDRSDKVNKIYIVCKILRNSYACSRGNETLSYFQVIAPTLEEYFR